MSSQADHGARMPEMDLEQSQAIETSRPLFTGPRRLPHGSNAGVGVAFAALDALIVLAAGLLGYVLRGRLVDVAPMDMQQLPHLRLFGFLVCYAILTVICNAAQNLYSDAALVHAARLKILKSFVLSSLLTITVLFLTNEKTAPRLIIGGTMVFSLAGLFAGRQAMRRRNSKLFERGVGTQHVLVVGAGPVGRTLQCHLQSHRHLGKTFCGFVDETEQGNGDWLGTPEDLPRILKEQFIDEIYFTPEISREVVVDVARKARQERIGVKVVPDLYGGLALGAGWTYVSNIPVLELNCPPISALGLFLKRLMDLTIAGILLLVTAPFTLLAAMAIKLDSRGPVLYTAWRIGRKGHRFLCYKFRTMVADADAQKERLRNMNERNGATFKIASDPRVTRLGRFLRRYSADELPQLLNVLKGEMSMVGPRPHPVDDYRQYQLDDLRRLDVLPGITGLWQVSARRDPSFEKNVLLDLEYIQNWNVWLDVKILLKTIPEVFRGSGR